MEKNQIIESIAKRGNGEIYLGVVGAVRTGKSTFIKRFIEKSSKKFTIEERMLYGRPVTLEETDELDKKLILIK